MQDPSSASVNWPQAINKSPRQVPTPAAVQAASSENTQVSQRALAWTGHLEWQDTVSTILQIKVLKHGCYHLKK